MASSLHCVVLLRHTRSKFGVLSAMTDGLCSALDRAGIQTFVIDRLNIDTLADEIKRLAPDCTLGVNISVSEHLLFYPLNIPHVAFYVDTLVHYLPGIFERPHSISLIADGQSEKLFQTLGGRRSHWFPHAIAKETVDRARSEEPIPLDKRPFDVCLPGSYLDHREPLEHLGVDLADRRLLLDLVQRALFDLSFPFFAEVFSLAEQRGLDPVVVGTALESVLRGLDRERLIKSLPQRTVNIFTSAEDAVRWLKVSPNSLFRPSVDFQELFDLCAHSKVVLNSVPSIRPGYHERLLLSLASGAITVTERGRVPSWLVERGRVVEYDTASMETLQERIHEAEGRPYDRMAVLEYLDKEHTWDVRLHMALPAIEREIQESKDNR